MTDVHKETAKETMQFAREAMRTNFTVDGKMYNMEVLGWELSYNNNKSRLGVCKPRTKTIELSIYFLKANEKAAAELKDTILHEIAHAIDFEMRGTSDHSERWKRVARAVGADDSRTADVDMTGAESKYTGVCPKCKKVTPMHRRTRALKACGKCCNEYNRGRFSDEFIIKVTQNY